MEIFIPKIKRKFPSQKIKFHLTRRKTFREGFIFCPEKYSFTFCLDELFWELLVSNVLTLQKKEEKGDTNDQICCIASSKFGSIIGLRSKELIPISNIFYLSLVSMMISMHIIPIYILFNFVFEYFSDHLSNETILWARNSLMSSIQVPISAIVSCAFESCFSLVVFCINLMGPVLLLHSSENLSQANIRKKPLLLAMRFTCTDI